MLSHSCFLNTSSFVKFHLFSFSACSVTPVFPTQSLSLATSAALQRGLRYREQCVSQNQNQNKQSKIASRMCFDFQISGTSDCANQSRNTSLLESSRSSSWHVPQVTINWYHHTKLWPHAQRLQTRKFESQLDLVYLLKMLRSNGAQIFHLCNGGEFQHQRMLCVLCRHLCSTPSTPTSCSGSPCSAFIVITLLPVSNNMMFNMTYKIIINLADMIIIHLLCLQCLACENITGLFLPPAADTSETDYQWVPLCFVLQNQCKK